MAESVKTGFPGIATKSAGSELSNTEWNHIVNWFDEMFNQQYGVIDIGVGTTRTKFRSILLGQNASDEQVPEGSSNENGRLAIGAYSHAGDWRAVAIGEYAVCLSVSGTVLGYGSSVDVGNPHGCALGRGAMVPDYFGWEITVIGTGRELYLSNGYGHYYPEPPSTINAAAKPIPSDVEILYHGQDAKDYRYEQYSAGKTYGLNDRVWDSDKSYRSLASGNLGNTLTDGTKWEFLRDDEYGAQSDYNVDGGHIGLCGGAGTGTGAGGEIRFKTSPTSGAQQNTKNPFVDAGKFDSATGEDTRFLLLDTTDGTMKRVSFGADDSAGAGFKTLRVEN